MMSTQQRLPALPHGSPTIIRGLSETFAFHFSPEAFITSRVLAFQASHPSLANSRIPIRAKVLNRNVAVISSYHHVQQILGDDGTSSKFSAGKAYDELMAPFFPPPNLLLADPPVHQSMKNAWKARMMPLSSKVRPMVNYIVLEYFSGFKSGVTIDLYETMKELSWRLILGIFLSPSADNATKIEKLQEDLLRGQFSMFPVSMNTGLWRSPRSKGLAAREKLQALFKARMVSGAQGCPFAAHSDQERGDIASHLLLFTSSLAVKSLASLLTALLLNVFIHRRGSVHEDYGLASYLESLEKDSDKESLLESIVLETERLSPPVVGIMRRTTEDVVLKSAMAGLDDSLLPNSWDVWLYFAGAARDPAIFGETADSFRPDRYFQTSMTSASTRHGLAFGTGHKSCLGEELMRDVVMTVLKSCLGNRVDTSGTETKIDLQGNLNDIPRGVQGWLGWQQGVEVGCWARDMKQLPTQRPSNPVMVQLLHNLG